MLLLLIISNSVYVQDDLNKSINFYEMEAVPIDRLDTLPIEETYSYEEALNIMIESGVNKDFIETFKNNHKLHHLKQWPVVLKDFKCLQWMGLHLTKVDLAII